MMVAPPLLGFHFVHGVVQSYELRNEEVSFAQEILFTLGMGDKITNINQNSSIIVLNKPEKILASSHLGLEL